ncbi:glycosyltransferase family 2 protein [Pediococcus pentosaceus]|uniref:glycosyltransferase family 2 protein n=1 Tax=Pediococcus TaxID=1253 RepID=UPI0018A19941|nr:glycosyltransferase family 2 protein [Pediococcus pentosaceus]MBF7140630.1 glycosyltransferase family 2 protein [Pediococcus pentosaceus]
MKQTKLTIVVPCYNEEEVLPISAETLRSIMQQMIDSNQVDGNSKILFVNDGSKDKTWSLIKDLESKDNIFTGLKFSRNFGHQNALMAGMKVAGRYSDCVITIDADLQDDENLISKMVASYQKGNEVVLGVRNDRSSDSHFKRWTAETFYSVMGKMGVQLVPDHADFRLLGKRAVDVLMSYKETNLFLRGIIPQLGFNTDQLYYQRKPRLAGETKYPLKKMLSFAFDGITSFSIAPIKAIMSLGILVIGISLIMVIYSIIRFFTGNVISGWASIMTSLWFLGGIQLIGISVIGEYLGKIYAEVKHRPRYIIETDDYSATQQTHVNDTVHDLAGV